MKVVETICGYEVLFTTVSILFIHAALQPVCLCQAYSVNAEGSHYTLVLKCGTLKSS